MLLIGQHRSRMSLKSHNMELCQQFSKLQEHFQISFLFLEKKKKTKEKNNKKKPKL